MTDKIAAKVVARVIKGFDLNKVKKIQQMTDRNDHQNAYVEGAKLLGAKHLEKKFKLVADLYKLEGHMPSGLRDYSYSLYKDLMTFAQQQLPPSDYELFSSAF